MNGREDRQGTEKGRDEIEAELDAELEGTFPASDPPKMTRFRPGHEFTPTAAEKAEESEREEGGGRDA